MIPWLLLLQVATADSANASRQPRAVVRDVDAPSTRFRVRRLIDMVHVSRIEGLYTGWGVERASGDSARGLTLQANAGWAWSEHVARGRGSAELTRGAWTYLLRGGRTLEVTNDFRTALDSGSTLGALLSIDNYDYVDRSLAAVGVVRRVETAHSVWRLETGPAHDAVVRRMLDKGLYKGDSSFRENRGAWEGRYWRTAATLEWHPEVNAVLRQAGAGALLTAEHAIGALDYTRVEGRLTGRRIRGPLTLAGRFDAGVVLGGALPPQQLFEMGRNQGLQGYSYKEFGGNQAALVRSLAMMQLPFLQSKIRIRRWSLPGPTPALAVATQGTWSDVRGDGARRANESLWQPLRGPTGGIRSSLTMGLRFFGGLVGTGIARRMDQPGRWRLSLEFGPAL